MGKLRGFMEYDRIKEPVVTPKKRIRNYKEFTIAPNNDELLEQGEGVWIAESHFVTVVVH